MFLKYKASADSREKAFCKNQREPANLLSVSAIDEHAKPAARRTEYTARDETGAELQTDGATQRGRAQALPLFIFCQS